MSEGVVPDADEGFYGWDIDKKQWVYGYSPWEE
jgi:hypothetical protein